MTVNRNATKWCFHIVNIGIELPTERIAAAERTNSVQTMRYCRSETGFSTLVWMFPLFGLSIEQNWFESGFGLLHAPVRYFVCMHLIVSLASVLVIIAEFNWTWIVCISCMRSKMEQNAVVWIVIPTKEIDFNAGIALEQHFICMPEEYN